MSTLLNPAAIMGELLERLRAAVIPAGLALAGQPLFQTVQPYDLSDLADALEKLLLTDERVAVLVLESVPAKTERIGANQVTTLSFDFAVMFTDRNLASRTEAMLGSPTNPGALNIVPAVIEACVGDMDGPVCRAGNEPGRLLALTGRDGSNNFDRVCYRQPLTVTGGRLNQRLGRSALT